MFHVSPAVDWHRLGRRQGIIRLGARKGASGLCCTGPSSTATSIAVVAVVVPDRFQDDVGREETSRQPSSIGQGGRPTLCLPLTPSSSVLKSIIVHPRTHIATLTSFPFIQQPAQFVPPHPIQHGLRRSSCTRHSPLATHPNRALATHPRRVRHSSGPLCTPRHRAHLRGH